MPIKYCAYCANCMVMVGYVGVFHSRNQDVGVKVSRWDYFAELWWCKEMQNFFEVG